MYVGMIETRFLKILLRSFHENYSDLFKKTTQYNTGRGPYSIHFMNRDTWAGQNLAAGHIWPTGRTLDMSALTLCY